MPGIFNLIRRSQHAAAAADDSPNVVVFDLFLGFEKETQARHFILAEDPTSSQGIVGEICAAVSKEKLTLGKEGPQVIEPNAVGRREDGQSVSGDVTSTRMEMVDTGSVEMVSDQPDAMIFQFQGQKLQGRMMLTREGSTKRFKISLDGTGLVDDQGSEDKKEDPDPEDETKDPEKIEVEDFVTPEMDEILRVMIEEKSLPDEVEQRLRAIRQRLSSGQLTKRDVTFVLSSLVAAKTGAQAVGAAQIDFDTTLHEDVFVLETRGNRYEVKRNDDGTYRIDRYEFLKKGIHNEVDFDDKRLDEVVENFKTQSRTEFLDVPIKIGHHKNQSLLANSGELAGGWVKDVWREGDSLYSKVDKIPRMVAFLMKREALKNRSAEIFREFQDDNGKQVGFTLKAIALLGTSTPAVRGMQPAAAASLDTAVQMYSDEDGNVIYANLRSQAPMPDDDKTQDKDKGKSQEPEIKLSQAELDTLLKKHGADVAEKTAAKLKTVFEKDNEELKGQITSLSDKLGEEKKARRKADVKAQKSSDAKLFEELVKAGNLAPALKSEFIALCAAIDGTTDMAQGQDVSDLLEGMEVDKDELHFSYEVVEDDKTIVAKEGLKDMFLRLIRGGKQVEFEVKSKDKKKDDADAKSKVEKKSNSEKLEELTQKIMSEQKLDYADAMEIAFEEQFGDEALEMALASSIDETDDDE